MSQIDPTIQLAALIRSQVSALRRTPQRLSSKKTEGKTSQSQDLATLVARRVTVVDPADPNRHRKAFKIFLESVLLAELGEELSNDPAFYAMVEQVQQQMESDVALAASMHAAAEI